MKKKISSEEPKKKKNHIRKCIHILIKILDNIIAKIVYILLFAIFLAFIYKEKNKFITLMNITERENYTIKTKAKRKGREYLNKCLEGKLTNNSIFKLSENPKVTIIIPLYNTGKRIKLIIRSIQNQNIEDIEIILVNDFSKDNTLEIIEKLKEEDPRITIINNSKNMGVLYSRSVGVFKLRENTLQILIMMILFLMKMSLTQLIRLVKMENLILLHLCILIVQVIIQKLKI